jgi:hypothetical protein
LKAGSDGVVFYAHGTDFNGPVTVLRRQAGCLKIKNYDREIVHMFDKKMGPVPYYCKLNGIEPSSAVAAIFHHGRCLYHAGAWPGGDIVLESLPVCAAAAHGVHDPLPGKSFPDGGRARRGKDFRQCRLKDIAQGDVAFGIQTARHHRPVHQNGDMVTQSAAVAMCTTQVRSRGMGPGKTAGPA